MLRYFCYKVFVSCILLSGCMYTEGILEIKGKVLEENTNIAIPNRKIIIQGLVKDDNKFKSSYVGEFFTDSSGYFEYTLKKIKYMYLYDFCIIGDSIYAYSNTKLRTLELNSDSKFLTFYVSKLTDLTIKIYRKSKTSFCDTLYVSWESNGISDEILYPYKIENYGVNSNKRLRFIGGDIHASIKTKVFADKKTIIYWRLFRNGKYKEITDTILCSRDINNSICLKY
jgi:hypothetical protein